MFVTWYRCCDVCKSPAYTVIAFACSSIFRAFFNARCYILWIIRFHDALLNDLWLWAGLLHNYFACFPLILEPACFQEKWNSNCLIFHELGFVAHDLRQTQHTYYMYISFPELVQFINCETVCFLCDLSVTNNDFEHACYALPHYTLP